MRTELRKLRHVIPTTTIYVTHESGRSDDVGGPYRYSEPLGRIEQIGTPEEVYDTPASTFVAGFIRRAGDEFAAWRGCEAGSCG